MTKERRHMKVRLIRRTPPPILLHRERRRRRDRPEEVHAPLRALRTPGIDIKKPERDLHLRDPLVVGRVELRGGRQLVGGQVGDVEAVEGGAGGADLGRVVDEGREGDVVGGDFELEVGLRVGGAEGL